MIDIAEGRLQRAVAASERFEPKIISHKVTTTRRTGNPGNSSIMLVVPKDLYSDLEELHQKAWRGQVLNDGSLLFKPI